MSRAGAALAPVTALVAALLTAGCASSGGPAGAEGAAAVAPAARTAPDDRDLAGLIPAGPETVLEIDLGQLRESAWSRPLLTVRPVSEREARKVAIGYDDIADVDRMVFAVTETAGGPEVLTVAQGRFDAAALERAFAAQHPGATSDPWRGSALWRAGEQATALLTARTLVSGRLADVRAVIDCGWGLAGDFRSGELGPLRRTLEPDRAGPALLAVVTISPSLRQRVGGEFELPEGLHHVGARLDLGQSLDVALLGLLERPAQADAAARLAQGFLDDLRGRTILRVFGLASLLDGAGFQAEGARVRGKLHIPASERADLAQKVGLIFQTLMRARSP